MPSRVLVLALLVACGGGGGPQAQSDEPGDDDGEDDSAGEVASCDGSATTCVLIASTCCECPTFAVPSDDPFATACDGVECPAPAGCPALEAVCATSTCAVACAPIATTRTCALGFARDEVVGCLVDACDGSPGAPSCQEADDCVRVADDCCGCARGGADTAVAAGDVEAHEAALGCLDGEVCPGVDVCDDGRALACVAGRCALVGGEDDDRGGTFCGTPAYPACPDGTACVLNGDPAADALGVGRCVAPAT